MNGREYRSSLLDGRAVYMGGQRVKSVADHAALGQAVDAVAATYDHWATRTEDGINPLLKVTADADELAQKMPLYEEADGLLTLTYQAIMCLLTASNRLAVRDQAHTANIAGFIKYVQAADLRVALCITDAKGDRSLSPKDQGDLDAYTRIVARTEEGVVIRGAKLHITGAHAAHELLVMPTKAMKVGEEEYAVCCAVPVSSPGVKIISRSAAPMGEDARDYPISSTGLLSEAFVIFEDVFVPYDRVFLDGETTDASVFAHALGLWERLTALRYLADNADTLVGLAQLAAEANGLTKIPHIKEKVTDIVLYATTIRAGLVAAVSEAKVTDEGFVVPDEMYTNAAKYYGSYHHAAMVRNVQDIAGGVVVTSPLMADFDNPETAHLVEKYMATGRSSGRSRAMLMHAIRDFTADTAGGHRSVIQLHAGGGIWAQRLITRKHYDIEAAKARASALAGLPAAGLVDGVVR